MKEKEISSSIQQKAVTANEAVAWAALACGLDYFSHYPGSPVNTIEPFLKQLTHTFNQPVHFNDALNEHIAVLSAAGASLCGARSLVVMKHVGMNIAADPLNYLGYCGIRGGMVIVVGTDPGANSSTGEEDPHWYLPQINFPLFEPTNVQEVYQQIGLAFEMSESQGIPVVLFMPVRLCHNVSLLSLPAQFNRSLKTFYFEKNRDKIYWFSFSKNPASQSPAI